MRYKRLKQKDSNDCAIACLISIIRYYGGNNTYEYIRELLKCDESGVTAYDLIEASKTLGFSSRGLRCKIDNLYKDITLPAIIHTTKDNYNHYMVLESINKSYVYVHDPGLGTKKYNIKQFLKIWNNIVIELKKEKDLEYITEENINYFKILNNYKLIIFIIISISLISMFLSTLNNYYFKISIDGKKDIYMVFIIFVILKVILDYLNSNILINTEMELNSNIFLKLYQKLISLPYNYFNSRQKGDILSRVFAILNISEVILKIPLLILISVFLAISSGLILLTINKKMSIFTILFITVYFSIHKLYSKHINNKIKTLQEKESILKTNITENISGISTIKNFNIEEYSFNKIKDSYIEYKKEKIGYERTMNLKSSFMNLTLYIMINTIIYIGVKDNIKLSNIILYNSVVIFFLDSINNIFNLEENIKIGANSLRRVKEIFVYNKKALGYKNESINTIKINKLSFSYKNDNNVISNLDLFINIGENIALIGDNGSGKSTLFKLITKQYSVKKNTIYINNIDINMLDDKYIKDNICYVSENEKIFSGTILENITLGKNDTKDIDHILSLTYFDLILKNKNMNKFSYIKEDGIELSLGERQILVLCRCLFKNTNIIILDESLNGISIELEEKILKNILNKNRTIIFITHRMNNVKLFDNIINISDINERII